MTYLEQQLADIRKRNIIRRAIKNGTTRGVWKARAWEWRDTEGVFLECAPPDAPANFVPETIAECRIPPGTKFTEEQRRKVLINLGFAAAAHEDPVEQDIDTLLGIIEEMLASNTGTGTGTGTGTDPEAGDSDGISNG